MCKGSRSSWIPAVKYRWNPPNELHSGVSYNPKSGAGRGYAASALSAFFSLGCRSSCEQGGRGLPGGCHIRRLPPGEWRIISRRRWFQHRLFYVFGGCGSLLQAEEGRKDKHLCAESCCSPSWRWEQFTGKGQHLLKCDVAGIA